MAKGGNGTATALRALGAFFMAAPMLFSLSACSEKALDTGLIGSVIGDPSPVSDNTSPIRPMTGERTDYPNLGSVPARPTNLTTDAQRQKRMDRLTKDRAASRKRKAETDAIPMPAPLPTPLPVPPKPNLQPGKS